MTRWKKIPFRIWSKIEKKKKKRIKKKVTKERAIDY